MSVRFDSSTINAESCLAMNRAYQELLLDTLRQIEMSLTENRAKQVIKTLFKIYFNFDCTDSAIISFYTIKQIFLYNNKYIKYKQ